MRKILSLGFLLILVGLGLVVLGTGTGSVSTGGVVFIGPIPIVFGSGPQGLDLALVSVVISGVMVVALLLMGLRGRRRLE